MLAINSLYKGDCIEVMKEIDDKSIDMVLCDLPYGVTARNKWDIIIPFDKLWEQWKRIAKESCPIVLTAIQPFTSVVVMSNPEMFKYEWIWEKQQGTGFLNAKKQPLRNHEQVLVFYRKQPVYNPQFTSGKPYKCKSGKSSLNYGEQISVVTENIGKRYPLTIQQFPYDKEKLHPTQKPLKLFKYLIKTYTNENNLVLDNCFGSGTTCVAAKQLNRNYIGIELNEKYCKIAYNRLKDVDKSRKV